MRKENIIQSLAAFAATAIAALILLWVLAIGEIAYSMTAHGLEINGLLAMAIACLNTTIGWLLIVPWLLALFLLVNFISSLLTSYRQAPPRLSLRMLQGIFLLLLIVHLLLMNYFSKALVPLGADLYGYSWKDIKQTVGAAGGIAWQFILLVIILLALQYLLFHVTRKKLKVPAIATLSIMTVGIILTFTGPPDLTSGSTEFTRNLLTDKFSFFVDRSWEHFFPHRAETDIYADSYLPADPSSMAGLAQRHYIDLASYPFLYKDSTTDVLTPFINSCTTPPNIVLVLVEGLGRAFTNEHAYLGNFTPFLDSLSQTSLYWDNFLSEGGRTFAVLSSVLGSLPFAKNGFLEMGDDMPPHFSLVNLLRANGYHGSFYYGGDAHFDNMDLFLRRTGIDEVNDGATFPSGYTRIPSSNGFTWGYNDQSLFRRWLDSRPEDSRSPQLSVILTVSTHSPFLLNDPVGYNHRFELRMKELGFTEDEIQEHRHYKDQYASILYTDQALRDFFTAFAKRKDFDHTIFVITGDHRIPEIPMRDKIDRYHVPLLIYSPMLARHARFSSVSTHFDIAPSLLAWLGHVYGWQLPSAVTWMGDGLDTARAFRNIHSYPLMQTKTDLVDYIKGDLHLNNTSVFRLKDGLEEEPVSDKSLLEEMMGLMDAYKQRNDRWLRSKSLLPDSMSRRIGPDSPTRPIP